MIIFFKKFNISRFSLSEAASFLKQIVYNFVTYNLI
tara:strand:+ start:76079 stop:76186 length:108 start_codon:yes stop_codon:yes gene_type:complete